MFTTIFTAEAVLKIGQQAQSVADKVKIKYAKEFFVTEKGEVIKMAAIVTQNPYIRQHLEQKK